MAKAKRKVSYRYAMSKNKKTLFTFANADQRREAIKNEKLIAIGKVEMIERLTTGTGISLVDRKKG